MVDSMAQMAQYETFIREYGFFGEEWRVLNDRYALSDRWRIYSFRTGKIIGDNKVISRIKMSEKKKAYWGKWRSETGRGREPKRVAME